MATSLSQYGITWTFDGDYTTGQYANVGAGRYVGSGAAAFF